MSKETEDAKVVPSGIAMSVLLMDMMVNAAKKGYDVSFVTLESADRKI